MTMNKFEIGQVWRLENGRKAIIVDVPKEDGSLMLLYMYPPSGSSRSGELLSLRSNGVDSFSDYSLSERIYPGRKEHSVSGYVQIYKNANKENEWSVNLSQLYKERPAAYLYSSRLIAVKKIEIKFYEGEGL